MLSRKEKKVMTYIYSKCKGKESSLISPQEIANFLMPTFEVNTIEVDQIINALVLDNYIEVVHSDNKGKLIYVISLKQKGASFEREVQHNRKTTYIFIARTVILAILSFVVTLILKAIFLS